jgi:hypothetical protein
MTTWYSIELNDSEAAATLQKVMNAFTPKYVGSGRPLGMAVFSSHDKTAKATTIYFSPQAASLALQFGAGSCDSNFVDVELSLLVGDESSIDYLFPEAEAR